MSSRHIFRKGAQWLRITAAQPGLHYEDKGKIVVMLSGPPPEMMPMLDDTVIPYLAEKSGYRIVSKYLRFLE